MPKNFFKPKKVTESKKLLTNVATVEDTEKLKQTINTVSEAGKKLKEADVLLTAKKGFLSKNISQDEIRKHITIGDINKKVDIIDEYGPYNVEFSRDSQFMLLGGKLGHIMLSNWKTKKTVIDINVKQEICDIKFLHKNNRFATAQNENLYVYDESGTEMHCVRDSMHRIKCMEYLPYHFLLVAGQESGFLSYFDVSVGEVLTSINTYRNSVKLITQDPTNAVIYTAHTSGVVNLWTPNQKNPVMKMYCSPTELSAITVDSSGNYLVTAGVDKKVKMWDIRFNAQQLNQFIVGKGGPINVQMSQTGKLAVATMQQVTVLDNPTRFGQKEPSSKHFNTYKLKENDYYLTHEFDFRSKINQIKFIPFEDMLACAMHNGVQSIYVPGSGEANFDGYECNPYGEVKYRQEKEVKDLLHKIPAEMISLTVNTTDVVTETIEEEWERERNNLLGKGTEEQEKKPNLKRKKLKAATARDQKKKDNIHYERKTLKRKLFEADNIMYKKKQHKLEKTPIGNALDHMIYNEN